MIIQFIFGTIIGSFICLIAERIPVGKSIISPASQCSYCKTKLRFYDLLPLISILYLNFRCRYCKAQLSSIYFISECCCGFLCILAFSHEYPFYTLLFLLTAFSLSLTDIFYYIVDPLLFIPLTILLYITHFILGFSFFWPTSIFIYLLLNGLNHFFQQSIGDGDIYLLTAWASLLHPENFILLVLFSSTLGLLSLLGYHLLTKQSLKRLPFVPFLNFGLCIIFLLR